MPKESKRGCVQDNNQKPLRFDERLVLQQWLLSLLGMPSFESVAEKLRGADLEGFNEDNTSRFYEALCLHIRAERRPELTDDALSAYDQNIVRHWRQITERRNHEGTALYPKYFQYLALLFTEIYLDRYFRDADGLLEQLNEYLERFNESLPQAAQIGCYKKEDLNKLAFWMATGSGKTLLMHVNILQYRHYLNRSGSKPLDRIILLTPNEGLSHQHLEEFRLSGMDAEIFSKEGRDLFTGHTVTIIDIHKLRDEAGEKTVAVEAFEGNNLVLVDEGHRGTSGAETGKWMEKRNRLCENGFSFEYSATFGQAVKASANRELEQTYAKCILFDYSYKYFYGDGYGKDYCILNLANDSDENIRRKYLTACLLSFYQQLKLYEEKTGVFQSYLIERPLLVFVGGSVNAVRTRNQRKVSDVIDVLLFLAAFVRTRDESIKVINDLLAGHDDLIDVNGQALFRDAFQYLRDDLRLTPEQVFDDILRVLFNASTAAALHVEHLKDTDGEIALRLGNNDAFGVINVGDASALCKLCEERKELVVTEKAVSGSLFRTLNSKRSRINILIGSKKFTEGWSSWRVSTMGLMNIGRSEGPQIIQLFGRGVRLKGKGFSLKRSRALDGESAPKHIRILETLTVFGVRADYMRQFKAYLDEEGVEEQVEFTLPVVRKPEEHLGGKRLKIIRLKDGVDFRKSRPKPVLGLPEAQEKKHPAWGRVYLDWYPKLQAMASAGGGAETQEARRDTAYFDERHLAFLDFDAMYFELQRYKRERGWHNLELPRASLPDLLKNESWYVLYIPKKEMETFNSFQQVRRWQEIATTLLKKYVDRYYKFKKQEFESNGLEYRELSDDDPNFFSEYKLLIEKSRDGLAIAEELKEIKRLIETGKLLENERAGPSPKPLQVITFDRHLYQPLIYAEGSAIKVRPTVLENESERDFVLDLQAYCESDKGKAFLRDKALYLLRNLSRGRGIGFFEAGNFYPDFIFWLLVDGKQYVSFIDPKGIVHIKSKEDPKVRFYQTVKELQARLGDSDVVLNSFIISNTPFKDVSERSMWKEKEDAEAHNILFQYDDPGYIEKLLRKVSGQ